MSLAANLTPDQSQSIIYQQLIADGIPATLAVLVTAQSAHETAARQGGVMVPWTSNVYLTDNNAFGYGYTGSGYKQYDSVEGSADDLAAYLNRRVADGSFPALDQITGADQYASLLKSAGYYTDTESNYSAGISNFINSALTAVQTAVTQNSGSSITVVLIIAIFAFVLINTSKRSFV